MKGKIVETCDKYKGFNGASGWWFARVPFKWKCGFLVDGDVIRQADGDWQLFWPRRMRSVIGCSLVRLAFSPNKVCYLQRSPCSKDASAAVKKSPKSVWTRRSLVYDRVTFDYYRTIKRRIEQLALDGRSPGPATWADQFPAAGGAKQSPINISHECAHKDSSLRGKPLHFSYNPEKCKVVANPGYCWKVEVDGEDSILEGGPLEHTYQLEQFHFHWGCNDKQGSEHTIEGRAYPAEAHLVHWNRDLYSSFDEASKADKGLCVLGAFLQVGEEHSELTKLTDLLDIVKHKGEIHPLDAGFDPATLVPNNRAYWTYEGSLTTPPCTESVVWIVFKNPINVSEEQLSKFRNLRNYSREEECPCDEFEGHIYDNYRPPLPLNDRELRYCRGDDTDSD